MFSSTVENGKRPRRASTAQEMQALSWSPGDNILAEEGVLVRNSL